MRPLEQNIDQFGIDRENFKYHGTFDEFRRKALENKIKVLERFI